MELFMRELNWRVGARGRRDGCMDSCVAGYPRLDRPMTSYFLRPRHE
jgi:hypothetical protein